MENTLATVLVPRRRDFPQIRPQAPVADKAYDSREFRHHLRRCGIEAAIPPCIRLHRQQPRRERPIRTGPNDRHRWQVERGFG